MPKARRREPARVVPAAPTRNRTAWPMIAVVCAACVYLTGLEAPFAFDDEASIVDNASIRRMSTALAPPHEGEPVAGRPAVNLTFALNYAAGGVAVEGYRLLNVAIHAACALTLFGLVRNTLRLRHGTRDIAHIVALAVALIWALHPLNSETVNYVSQRTESLMALCYLLTLYWGCARAASTERPRAWFAPLAVAACAIGMACKEVMVTAPVVALLYDRTYVAGTFAAALRRRLRFYAALAATWVLLAALIWNGPRWESAGFATGITPWTYLLNQTIVLIEYARRVIWPVSLVLDYGEPRVYSAGDVLLHALIVLALVASAAWGLLRRSEAGSVAAAVFIILAPTSSFVPIATEAGAERRMYLPLALLVTLAVTAGAQRLQSSSAAVRRVGLAAGVVMLGAFATLTVLRTNEYQSGVTLWSSSLERWPTSRAHRNLATELKRSGRAEEVIPHLRATLLDHPEARYALGFELYEQGRYADAAPELQRFIRDYPNAADVGTAHLLIGQSLLRERQFDGAAEHLRAAAARQPRDAEIWLMLAAAREATDDLAGAQEALGHAATLRPRDAHIQLTLGLIREALGDLEQAEAALRRAVELDPNGADAQLHLRRVRLRRPLAAVSDR